MNKKDTNKSKNIFFSKIFIKHSPKKTLLLLALFFVINTIFIFIAGKVIKTTSVGIISFFTIILLAWNCGKIPGILGGLLNTISTAIAMTHSIPNLPGILSIEPIISMLGQLIIGFFIGYVSELVFKYKKEITKRKKIETELLTYKTSLEKLVKERTSKLKEANEYLRQAEKMEALGKLTGGIAHDFNNMLSGIIGLTEYIKSNYNNEIKKGPDKYLDKINDICIQASEIIAKLLSFSRKVKFEIRQIEANDLVEYVINFIKHFINKQIIIKKKLYPSELTIMGNKSHLQNIFMNLVINAKDAMPDGGNLGFSTDLIIIGEKYSKMHPDDLIPGEYVIISVSDTGIGMDKKLKSKIFEPFFTTKSMGKGTGMGLASVYGTIKEHKGSIAVYSEKGKGSTFKLYFPAIKNNVPEYNIPEIKIIKGTGTILLAEDDDVLRDLSANMLSDLGYKVHEFDNGEKALTFFKAHQNEIDLIFLDMVMPDINGYECYLQIKNISPNIKTIFTSGYFFNNEYQKLIEKGAINFIQKPYDIKRLSQMINKVLKEQD